MRNYLDVQHIPKAILDVCTAIKKAGGAAWLVGGSVRDLLLGIKPNDWDIEVYGLPPERLQRVLEELGRCAYVGKQFGVIKLWLDSLEIDVALPRTEVKTGNGHQAFAVTCDPFINPKQAVLRRDFTINAMMFDPLVETLLDFHGGREDLEHKLLRHVSPAFGEDPLRPLRAMQFAARFQLRLHTKTAALCHDLLAEAASLPASRIWHEWLKWAKSDDPSFGLEALRDMGWLRLYPELQALIACPQDAYWHPEGDVWIHTGMVVDAAAGLKHTRELSEKEQLMLMFAALCHDLGKPEATFCDESGKIRATQHDVLGKRHALSFLQRIAAPKYMHQPVLHLVQDHMAHLHGKLSARAVSRLSYRLSPASIALWEVLTEADASGRLPAPPSRPALPWLKMANELQIHLKKPVPMVTGKVLLAWGLQAGPHWGALLEDAYQAQLDGLFEDECAAKIWLQKNSLAD